MATEIRTGSSDVFEADWTEQHGHPFTKCAYTAEDKKPCGACKRLLEEIGQCGRCDSNYYCQDHTIPALYACFPPWASDWLQAAKEK